MRCVWTDDLEFIEFCSCLKTLNDKSKAIEEIAQDWIKNSPRNVSEDVGVKVLKASELVNRAIRLDFISPFLEDPGVSEIMVNGIYKLFVEKGSQRQEYNINISEERLNVLVQRIVSAVNRSVNLREPIVDARLADGSRVNIVLKPIAVNGPIITIRKFKRTLKNLNLLEATGAIDAQMKAYLQGMVKDKKSIFVSGSTSSGKTTLLNCLCDEINSDERIITIEDSAELQLDSVRNLVSLETRTIRQNDLSIISMAELIKTSLRMRPDRIIVGEIRGAEAHDMLQAMNTGHEGSMSTGHANSAVDMLQRIETMALSSGLTNIPSIRKQIASGINYIIHMDRLNNGQRKIVEIIKIIDSGQEDSLNYRRVFTEESGWELD